MQLSNSLYILTILLMLSLPVLVFSATGDLSGWAWSSNIGWISFSCTDGGNNQSNICLQSNYGVKVDSSTGLFSGYAWSSNIGWITFNSSELLGCPSAPCEARLNFSTNKISGWARACSVFQSNCSGALDPNRGGWDGWIKLSDTSYGVTMDPALNELKGWAWGGDVVGWVSFNCLDRGVCETSNYKVFIGAVFKPEARDLNVAGQNYCSPGTVPSGQGRVHFEWTYCDDGDLTDDGLCNGSAGDNQSQFQFQVDNDSNFSSPVVDRTSSSTVLSGQKNSQVVSVLQGGGVDNLDYNTTYYWRVKVWDAGGNESDWTVGPTFTTEADPYPYPQIDFSPSLPSVNQEITFTTSTTECWGSCDRYDWIFWDKNKSFILKSVTCPGGSTICPWATMEYTVVGSYPVDLTITDNSSGQQCSATETVNIRGLPRWREIPPTSWIFEIFKIIAKNFNFYN